MLRHTHSERRNSIDFFPLIVLFLVLTKSKELKPSEERSKTT